MIGRRRFAALLATPLLAVPDTLAALHALAAFARGRFTGRLAAITGSVGKTTTKEMLRTILATQATVVWVRQGIQTCMNQYNS